LEHEQVSGLAKPSAISFDATNVLYGAGISCSRSIDEVRIPQRGDLAQRFPKGVSKERLRRIFGWARGSDDAGRLTGRVALTIKVTRHKSYSKPKKKTD
jgi:hypothetical protein